MHPRSSYPTFAPEGYLSKSILIEYQDGEGTWCIYWSDTRELAELREFSTLEEAGAVANALLARAALKLVDGRQSVTHP